MRRGSEKQMERLRHRVGAALGLVFGIGPTVLTGLIPSGLDHAGVVLLGAILGMRAGIRPPAAGHALFATAGDVAESAGGR